MLVANIKKVRRELKNILGKNLKQKEVLAPYTSFKIGGEADFFLRVKRIEELTNAVLTARELRIPYFVLGKGNNVLVSDQGFRGLIIINECKRTEICNTTISCQSGTLLKDLVKTTRENSLQGFEFLAGIPGTVGGAVFGNAGAFGKSIGEYTEEAVILTSSGNIEIVGREYFDFSYRYSKLKKTKDVLLSASFKLKKGRKESIGKRIGQVWEKRKKSIPYNKKSAGCFFKNVKDKGISAGYLLDQVGAKKMSVGEAKVFSKHANIIINSKNAKAKDVNKLARILKDRVKKRFKINLEEEVIYLGKFT
jgi:UDP-N-acetylmuramate dehydrogenase